MIDVSHGAIGQYELWCHAALMVAQRSWYHDKQDYIYNASSGFCFAFLQLKSDAINKQIWRHMKLLAASIESLPHIAPAGFNVRDAYHNTENHATMVADIISCNGSSSARDVQPSC